jgi:hypothetical protein
MCAFVTGGKGSSVRLPSGAVVERVWSLSDGSVVMVASVEMLQD